jgi:hypothetical protein
MQGHDINITHADRPPQSNESFCAQERIRVCHHSAKTIVAFGLVDRIADFLRHESESLMFSFPDVVDKLGLKQAAAAGSSEPAGNDNAAATGACTIGVRLG